ncbi:MAG: DUF4231 domain-containing protein [Ginsengibacter sp.]|jgi:hypothetical protein
MSGDAYTIGLPKTPEEYLDTELHPKLHRMAVHASFSKRMFFTLRTIAIIGGALLPILVSINKDAKGIQVLAIIISIAIALSIALEEALKFKEKYIKLEGLINIVNKLKGDFISQENEFANLTDQQRITKFASLSSSIILNSQNSLLEAFSNMGSPKKKDD